VAIGVPIARYIVTLETDVPVWDRFFTVSPLVLIGTREVHGTYDLAPENMAFQLGLENYFGFVCTPEHRTYQNARLEESFTVSFPRLTQVVLASLDASDLYAVVGVKTAFDLRSDLVTGVATTTQAGIRLIEKLTGSPALNLMQKDSWPHLVDILKERMALR